MPRIILDTPIETLPAEEQEKIWLMSRTNEVFIRDVNGELWQVLDLTVTATTRDGGAGEG